MIARPVIWGRLSAVGAVLAVLTYIIDQAHKWYMISVFNISQYQPVKVMPGFDLIMVWNYGISYGWFASHSQATRWILIVLSVFGSVCPVLCIILSTILLHIVYHIVYHITYCVLYLSTRWSQYTHTDCV